MPDAVGSSPAVRPGAGPAPDLDDQWAAWFHELVTVVAHDLKGALNSVSINVEVVRSRADRDEVTAADVKRYGGAAADQLGVVIRMTNALLSLARSPTGPVDVATIARQVVALVEDRGRTNGAPVTLVVDEGVSTVTAAPLTAVRLALAVPIVAAATAGRPASIRVRSGSPTVVDVTPAGDGRGIAAAAAVLSNVGIGLTTDGHGISIQFPGPTAPPPSAS